MNMRAQLRWPGGPQGWRITPGAPVKMAGCVVGRVLSLDVEPEWVTVTVEIEDADAMDRVLLGREFSAVSLGTERRGRESMADFP